MHDAINKSLCRKIVKYHIRSYNRTIHLKIGKFTLKSEALAGLHYKQTDATECITTWHLWVIISFNTSSNKISHNQQNQCSCDFFVNRPTDYNDKNQRGANFFAGGEVKFNKCIGASFAYSCHLCMCKISGRL